MQVDQFTLDLQKIISANQINNIQGPEYLILINNFTSDLSNLAKLIQYLPTIQNNIQQLMTIFILIRTILEKRGSLLSLEYLQNLIQQYFMIIGNLAPEIADSQIAPIVCDVGAYMYRFIYEILIENHPNFDPLLALVSSQIEPSVIMGLKMMISIIEIMKKPMKHIPFTAKNDQIRKSFEQFQLSLFFQIATEKAFNLNTLITPVALDLLVSIFKFLKSKPIINNDDEKEQLKFDFEVPKDMLKFYTDFGFIQNLFHVYQEVKLSSAIDVVTFYLSASKCSWNTLHVSPIVMINSIEGNLTQAIQISESIENATFSITRLIYKLGELIWISQIDSNTNLSQSFISNVHQYSLLLFQDMSLFYPSCNNLLRFWSVLFKNSNFIAKYISALAPFFSSVFQAYINGLLASIAPNMTFAEFTERYSDFDTFIEDCTPLIIIAQACIEPSVQFISGLMNINLNKLAENDPTVLLRLSMIVLIISSFFNGPISKIIQDNNGSASFFSVCIQLVFELINKTNQVQQNIVQLYGLNSTLLETSLVHFSSLFVKEFFTTKPILYSDEILQLIKITKQQAFEFLFDRFLKDLVVFIQSPETVISILSFFNKCMTNAKSELSIASESNETVKLFISRQLLLGINMIEDSDKLYNITSDFNQFIISCVSYDMISSFMSYFDNKFVNLALQNFVNSGEVLVLYREINGVLKGSTSSDKYTFVFHWMLRKHSEHTVQCVKAQSKDYLVLRSIMRVWLNLLKAKNLRLPGYSSEGLEIIKVTFLILNEINTNVKINDDVALYMVKILATSITSKNANFGIMKLFGDNTIDQMILILFNILKSWSFDSYCRYKDMLTTLSSTFNVILNYFPQMIQNDAVFPLVLNFYLKSFIHIKDLKAEFSNKNCEIYTTFTHLLRIIVKNQQFQIWSNFRPHLIVLLNTLFDTTSSVVSYLADALFLLGKYDGEFLAGVFQTILLSFKQSFDESFLQQMSDIFKMAMNLLNENNKPNKKTKAFMEKLSNAVRKYSIELDHMAQFTQFFA